MVKLIEETGNIEPATKPASEPAQSSAAPAASGQQLLNLDAKSLDALVKKMMPLIARYEMQTPRVWGDAKRVILRNTIHINDLLLNTRSGTITIEKDCFFGHRCMLLTGTHNYKVKGMDRLKDVPNEGRDIHVNEGVWMGSGVTVLGPCVIGENAVIAAGSLVTVDEIPANTIWAGRPAKQVKEIEYDE